MVEMLEISEAASMPAGGEAKRHIKKSLPWTTRSAHGKWKARPCSPGCGDGARGCSGIAGDGRGGMEFERENSAVLHLLLAMEQRERAMSL